MVFGGSSNDVQIKVTVDADGAIRAFDGLGKQVKTAEDATKGAAQGFTLAQSALVGFVSGLTQAATQALASALNFQNFLDVAAGGSSIDDVAESFKRLTEQAGVSGDALVSGLSDALDGTISKTDLMRQANELLRGGLKPDEFNDVAKAARVFAEETGGSAKDAVEQLSNQLLKGGTRFTDSIGLIIDNNRVLQEYADKNHIAAESLSEITKKEVIRAATIDIIKDHTQQYGEVTRDAGDRIDRAFASIADITDKLKVQIAGSDGLNAAFDHFNEFVKSIDIGKLGTEIGDLSGKMLDWVTNGLKFAVENLGKLQTVISDLIAQGAGFFNWIDTANNKLNELAKSLDFTVKGDPSSVFTKLQEKQVQQVQGAKELSGAITSLGEKYTDYKTKLTNLLSPAKLVSDAETKIKEAVTSTIKPIQDASYLTKQKEEASKNAAKAQDLLSKANDEFTISLRKSLGEEALPGVSIQLQTIYSHVKDGTETTEQAKLEILALSKAYSDSPEHIKQFTDALTAASDASQKAIDQGQLLRDALDKDAAEFAKAQKEIGDSLQTDLGKGLGDSLVAALNGGDVHAAIASAGTSLGSALGGAAGAAFGGPFGAALGQAFGGALGQKLSDDISHIFDGGKASSKGLGSLIDTVFPGIGSGFDKLIGDKIFGGESQGTATRKAIDKFFADAFDANHLAVIINGQLAQIKDLDLGGGSFRSADGAAGQFFAGLSESAQSAFSGVAQGFAQLTGSGEEAAVGLAAAFADNLGGSLNNLQLLVEATGQSFENLRGGVIKAFEDGKISALEAQGALNGLAQVAQQGIPDGIGFTVQAFQNLQAAGIKGGRVSTDAIRDIGAEAKELYIKDFPSLIQNLVSSGKLSSQAVQTLFDDLKAHGINSIDALSNATTEQLLPVLADLQNQKFPFADAANDAGQLITTIKDLPDEKTLTFNIKTNFDSNTKTAQDQGYVPSLASNVQSAGNSKSV